MTPFRIKDRFCRFFVANTKLCMESKQITITCSFTEEDWEISWKATFTVEADEDKEDSDGEKDEE